MERPVNTSLTPLLLNGPASVGVTESAPSDDVYAHTEVAVGGEVRLARPYDYRC